MSDNSRPTGVSSGTGPATGSTRAVTATGSKNAAAGRFHAKPASAPVTLAAAPAGGGDGAPSKRTTTLFVTRLPDTSAASKFTVTTESAPSRASVPTSPAAALATIARGRNPFGAHSRTAWRRAGTERSRSYTNSASGMSVAHEMLSKRQLTQ